MAAPRVRHAFGGPDFSRRGAEHAEREGGGSMGSYIGRCWLGRIAAGFGVAALASIPYLLPFLWQGARSIPRINDLLFWLSTLGCIAVGLAAMHLLVRLPDRRLRRRLRANKYR